MKSNYSCFVFLLFLSGSASFASDEFEHVFTKVGTSTATQTRDQYQSFQTFRDMFRPILDDSLKVFFEKAWGAIFEGYTDDESSVCGKRLPVSRESDHTSCLYNRLKQNKDPEIQFINIVGSLTVSETHLESLKKVFCDKEMQALRELEGFSYFSGQVTKLSDCS